jgi:dipeptidyl aminopeptidase/acylaminoacyl peptidase
LAQGSTLTAELAAESLIQRSGLVVSKVGVFWLESEPASGLNVVFTLDPAADPVPLLASTLAVGSQVNGYGGGALCVSDDTLYAVESGSQQIIAIDPSGGSQTALTNDAGARYGGLSWDHSHGRLLAVRESDGKQQLISIERGRPRVLHGGQDFYSAPAVSASGRKMAWVSWCLPDMPWVASELWQADVSSDGSLRNARVFPTPDPACVQQPLFAGETLIALSDHRGWWQPWQWDKCGPGRCLDEGAADGANAPWQLAESHHLVLPDGGWVRVRFRGGVGELWWQATFEVEPQRLADAFVDFRCLRLSGAHVYCVARSSDRLDAVLSIALATGQVDCLAGGERPFGEIELVPPEPFSVPASARSLPASEAPETPDVSGFYYPPVDRAATEAPLVMIAHGGPTSMAYAAINPQIQFLCHQGFAVAEVNYRGSSGFGRSFRMALGGQWGVLDVEDMERAAVFLTGHGKASEGRVAIQGRSAGGFTALMAMATSELFTAGVSQFGVSDPVRLRKLTHRFESGYLDWLLGPPDAPKSYWQIRSPVAQAHRIRKPVAFFQGGQDRVVVPQQTNAMAEAIRANGQKPLVRHYPDEGHGFRKAANQADMLRRLADFYQRTLK